MEDVEIIKLFLSRNEKGILELGKKYTPFCRQIAWNILKDERDTEECINDTWFSVWRSIPPKQPAALSAFCGTITRGLAIDRLRKRCAGKRTDTHLISIEEELQSIENLAVKSAETEYMRKEFLKIIEKFLLKQSELSRLIFIRRYWYLDSIKEISRITGKTQGSVKNKLYRMRMQLTGYLEKQGGLFS